MQHLVGFALLVLQAALLGWLSRTVIYPVLVVVLAGVGTFTSWRISLSRERAFLLSAGAAFFFLLKHRFAPHEFPFGSLFIRTQVAFIIAQFLLLIEAAQFVIRREEDPLPPVLPALGAVVMVCAADVQITNDQRPLTLLFAVTYPLLWALFLWTSRKPLAVPLPAEPDRLARRARAQKKRRLMAGVLLAAVATTAWFSSRGLFVLEQRIERWMVQMMAAHSQSSPVGFTRQAELGSLAHQKSEQEMQVALRVYSEDFPGYLRGAVFSESEPGGWRSADAFPGSPLMSMNTIPPGVRALASDENLFALPQIPASHSAGWRHWECWLAEEHPVAFAPLGTTHLIAAVPQVGYLRQDLFTLSSFAPTPSYTALAPEEISPSRLSQEARIRCLQVPSVYQRSLDELALKLFEHSETTADKIQAVEQHFHQHYRYNLGITIPQGEDPLLYFLRERPPAHCEYFATAAALLLRSTGVPCRYVTGFVPAEWNPSGQYWMARNRDAHAWVEAYDESRGWVTVEATPAVGVPSTDQPPGNFAWWDALRTQVRRLQAFVSRRQWDRVREILWSGLTSLPGLVLLLALAIYVVLRSRGIWRRRVSIKPVNIDPVRVEFLKLLKQVDQQMRRHGLVRQPGETLHQFAERIRAKEQEPIASVAPGSSSDQKPFADLAARWYHAYALARYQGLSDSQRLEELRTTLPKI